MNVKQKLELRMRRRYDEFLDRMEGRKRFVIWLRATHDAFQQTFSRLCRGAI